MDAIYSSIVVLGTSQDWLITANIILAALLCLWILRYRDLYLRVQDEQKASLDLIDNLSEGIYRSTPDGSILHTNPSLAKLNGYATKDELIASVRDVATEWYVQPGRREEFRLLIERDGRIEDFVSEVYRHRTRERIWVSEAARVVRDKRTGKALYYEGSVREVTETMQRLQLEEQFQKLTSQLPGGLFQMVRHRDGSFSNPYLSSGIGRLLGFSVEQYREDPNLFVRQIMAEDRDGYLAAIRVSAERLEPFDHEFRARTATGEERWLRVSATPEAQGGEITWHGYASDISLRKNQQIEIERLAFSDPLTQLPNRRALFDRMAEAIDCCRQDGSRGGLLFIDLDNFKTLNDTQGHEVGDAFLRKVAERLRESVRPRDVVARIGGDEFVVLLGAIGEDEASATQRAVAAANQALAALRKGFELRGARHRVSASIGVVVFDGSEDREELLKRADLAMYQAKGAGRNDIALFDPALLERETNRFRVLEDLRSAIADEALDLHFQPQVDRDGRTCGAEALLRWIHPEHGAMLPEDFVPLAEQSGLINEIGKVVLSRGLRELARWQAAPATADLRLAVNVSVQSFGSAEFLPFLRQQIELHGVKASGLTLELTENVLAKDQDLVVQRMRELKTLGIRLSLDDFGTGYSSLAYLKELPFDEVKIDGGFVADLEKTDGDRALVRMVLVLARTLGLATVAEHVENPAQAAILRAHGCDVFQGFLYSGALSADQFLDYVGAQGPGRRAAQASGDRLTA